MYRCLCTWGQCSMNWAVLKKSVAGEMRVRGNLWVYRGHLFIAWSLRFERVGVLHEGLLLVFVLISENVTMVWNERERSKDKAVQMDDPRVCWV